MPRCSFIEQIIIRQLTGDRTIKKQDTGHIIGVEGIDAVGKSTHTLLLSSWLQNNGFQTSTLSFPDYTTAIGKEINAFLSGQRSYPAEVRHMLFAANRWEKVEIIKKNLEERKNIIVNRYTESNLVYGMANGLSLDWLIGLEDGLPKPSLVLVLDASSSTLQTRRTDGQKDVYERDMDMQDKARVIYHELASRYGWVTINGVGTIAEVHDSIIKAVSERLGYSV